MARPSIHDDKQILAAGLDHLKAFSKLPTGGALASALGGGRPSTLLRRFEELYAAHQQSAGAQSALRRRLGPTAQTAVDHVGDAVKVALETALWDYLVDVEAGLEQQVSQTIDALQRRLDNVEVERDRLEKALEAAEERCEALAALNETLERQAAESAGERRALIDQITAESNSRKEAEAALRDALVRAEIAKHTLRAPSPAADSPRRWREDGDSEASPTSR